MKRPSLEEVKLHFKGAKKVKSTIGAEFIITKKDLEEAYVFSDCETVTVYVTKQDFRRIIYDFRTGEYAKILTYKNNDMKITKEFIKANADKTLKEVFTDLFNVELEVGKWYKWSDRDLESLACITDLEDSKAYGFALGRATNKWIDADYRGWSFKQDPENWTEATESEVFEALKNEAIKRYKKGDHVKCLYDNRELILSGIDVFKNKRICNVDVFFQVWMNVTPRHNACVFKDGKWASIIETITKEEAEAILNKKII